MCGINCLAGDATDVDIAAMNATLSHRGPDQCETVDDARVAMGLSRLSVLDVSDRGHQPMERDGYVIAYNGEIYNFHALREDLRSQGYSFESDTDTEVVLTAIAEYGLDVVELFNGIFAFVLYDRQAGQLHAVRDRVGVKPLYVYRPPGGLVVSSEIKSIVQHCDEDPFQLDGMSVTEYIDSKHVRSESLFSAVEALAPGEHLVYDLADDRLTREQLLDVYDMIAEDRYRRQQNVDTTTLVDRLDDTLNEAVERQLVSDVPLATVCSGGIDSSLVTAIAAQYDPEISVYNVSVDHPDLDERAYAERVADHLDLDITVETLDGEAFADRILDCTYHNDLPLIHPNSVGIAQVCERAHADGVKVLLTGEGADELFGGYSRYPLLYYTMLLNDLNPFRWLFTRISDASFLPFLFFESKTTVLETFLRDRTTPLESSPITSRRRENLEALCDRYDFIDSDRTRLSAAYMASDVAHYMRPLLRRTDRMSMRSSIEARVPYLDNEVLSFALNLPHEYKIRRRESKYLLKKVAERYLPHDIVYRDKQGFPLPIEEWLAQVDVGDGDYYDRHRSHQYDIWRYAYADVLGDRSQPDPGRVNA